MRIWPTFIRDMPQQGWGPVAELSGAAFGLTLSDAAMRDGLRCGYADDAGDLIAVSQMVAPHVATSSISHSRRPKT